jgi:hypothetical protein
MFCARIRVLGAEAFCINVLAFARAYAKAGIGVAAIGDEVAHITQTGDARLGIAANGQIYALAQHMVAEVIRAGLGVVTGGICGDTNIVDAGVDGTGDAIVTAVVAVVTALAGNAPGSAIDIPSRATASARGAATRTVGQFDLTRGTADAVALGDGNFAWGRSAIAGTALP